MDTIQQRNKKNRRRGRENEEALCKKLTEMGIQAELVPHSGALKGQPGDIRLPLLKLLFEAKSITSYIVDGIKYARINLAWISKAKKQASEVGLRDGVVVFRIKHTEQFYVIQSLEDYLEQASRLENQEVI